MRMCVRVRKIIIRLMAVLVARIGVCEVGWGLEKILSATNCLIKCKLKN